ncbi:MAG TPA: M28 family peptidase [Candidatus Lokiarchaeia archaeon]|nr:M28 family peptidase [Candidatus Lokiarchaeia archaeon]
MHVDDDLVQYAHDHIKTIIEKFGPRYSCSQAEHDANKYTQKRLDQFCDETHFEEFKTEPELYPQGLVKVVGILATIAMVFIPFGWGLPVLAPVLVIFGLFVFYTELFMMKRWIRFLFKMGTSCNTWGVVKPSGDVTFRVVIEGHVDSAKQMHMAEKDKMSITPLILGFVYMFFTIAMGIIKFLGEIIPGDFISTQMIAGPFQWSSIDWVYFLPTAILFPSFLYLIYGFTGDKVVPGASDNLSGCAVAAAVGKYFSEHRLNHVEIIVGSMGSEECGDRGARDFVNRHGDLLKNAYAYCVEEASTGNTFQFIEKDFHTKGMFYSPEVLDRMEKAAARHARDYPDAYPFMRRRLSFGSSDSCQYLVAGYKASFVISIEKPEGSATKITAKPPNWHSMRDSWERTNDKTLRDSIGMAMEFCMLVDEEQL